MKNISGIALIVLLLSCASCSQKNKSNIDSSFNDTLAVTKLLVQEIRKDLESKSDIDSIKEFWNGKLCTVGYRLYKEIENSQTISMIFGDINCDSLNDAIATIEYYTGGNRPEFTQLYVERTFDGYIVKAGLPLFGYRYVSVFSIENCVLEMNGKAWTNDDPMCCPSIDENFKAKLVGGKFEKVNENSQQAVADPNAVEFEKAKLMADSLKQQFDLIKHTMYKLSVSECGEGGFSEKFYLDSLYRLVYVERNDQSGDDVIASGFTIYGSDRTILRYSIGGYPKYESLWVNQHFYTKEIDSNNIITYTIREEADNNQRNNSIDFIKKISKQEFSYNSDSTYYYREVGEGNKDEFDYKVFKISIDSLLFVHLFGDK